MIQVLDKGSIELLYVAPDNNKLHSYMWSMYRGLGHPDLLEIAQAAFSIRAPIFVWMSLTSCRIQTFMSKNDPRLEFFCPSEADVKAKNLEASQGISRSMKMNAEGAALNTAAYKMDGCDTYLAQIGLPVSTYATGIATGSLREWLLFTEQENIPMPIEAYKQQVKQFLEPEFAPILASVRKYEDDKRKNATKTNG